MNIWLSHRWLQEQVVEAVESLGITVDERLLSERPTAGYLRDIEMVKRLASDMGWEISPSPEDADVELFIGPAFMKAFPSMHPSIIFTMVELDHQLTDVMVESINRYDLCIVPSLWCKQLFLSRGVTTPIVNIPHWIDEKFFIPLERDWDGDFVILTQSEWLIDRKGAWQVLTWFRETELPDDVKLIVKSSKADYEYDMISDNGRLRAVAQILDREEYLDMMRQALLLVYPSSGEGFGLMPGECALTGMCVSVSPVSSLKTEYLDKCNAFLSLTGNFKSVPFSGVQHFILDRNKLTEMVMLLYHDRDKLRSLARESQEFVRANYNYQVLAPKLSSVLESVLSVQKVVLPEPTLEQCFTGNFGLAFRGAIDAWRNVLSIQS